MLGPDLLVVLPGGPTVATLVFVLAGIAVVTVVALLAVGRLGELPDVDPDRPPTAMPEDRPVESADVDAVRFTVGMRGYRMDEVDEVLDRLAAEVAARDERIAELEGRAGSDAPAAASSLATAVDPGPAPDAGAEDSLEPDPAARPEA
jgi:DivIVA domain-containing protein